MHVSELFEFLRLCQYNNASAWFADDKQSFQNDCAIFYKVYINDDPGLTLTNFTERSN